MKKFIVFLLSTSMILGLVGCAAVDNGNATTTPSQTSAATETSTPADEANAPADEVNAPTDETSEAGSEESMGNKLSATFEAEIANNTDLEAVANKLNEVSEMDCMVIPAAEGFLTGFSDKVEGFKNGVQFSPMIGSIPFVGYVFESEDAEGLKATLLSLADPRWNVCTEASETVCTVSGNYVFFVMCGDASEEDF